MKKFVKSIELGGRKLTLSAGDLAQQAGGAVLATYGETVCLATVVAQPLKQEIDYFPLTVEYQEKLYAGGRIKGSRWVKREGRPTDEEILSARLIDRSVRPLFPKEYKKDVQIVITVLSVDMENPPEIVAGFAASAALAISSIPWEGPVGIIKVGLINDQFVTNPKESELATSTLDLVVSSTKGSIVMIEAGASEVPDDKIVEAIDYAQKEAVKVVKLIEDFVELVNVKKEKVEITKTSPGIQKQVRQLSLKKIEELILSMATKESGYGDFAQTKSALLENFEAEERGIAAKEFEDLFRKKIRENILLEKRPDGRKFVEIRKVTCDVAILPRTHGSALFNRGQTQALTITTIGAPSLEQFLESATGEETKRYIHHYSMPPFSSGETGKVGFPSRREIGHGALAERALLPVIPSEDDFPYTIRVVTEILSSNGSTSMAATCGSTLSLMDAGVPIKAAISGIAMGLVLESETKYAILTDIIGLEDGNGDMDFKVAGSYEGITALQLDVKTNKLTIPILKEAIKRSREARIEILEFMQKTISSPRDSVSKYAPKIRIIRIPVEKIGELIGPGGKTIRKIISETGCQVDVDDDGSVFVSATTHEELKLGVDRVESMMKEPVAGEIYEGEVKRVQPFGAFIEILPGKEGLVHVSDMSEAYVKDPSDLLKLGDKVQVRVKGIDDLGRLNLSMVLDPSFDQRKEDRRKEARNDRSRFGRDRFEGRRSGPPHFPTSRFLDEGRKRYR